MFIVIKTKHLKNDKYPSLNCDLNISEDCWMGKTLPKEHRLCFRSFHHQSLPSITGSKE